MNHKLIIIDGPSTVGKSPISKRVFKQIAIHVKSFWIHEECEKHPIRYNEFKVGDINIPDGMEVNKELMIGKWKILLAKWI